MFYVLSQSCSQRRRCRARAAPPPGPSQGVTRQSPTSRCSICWARGPRPKNGLPSENVLGGLSAPIRGPLGAGEAERREGEGGITRRRTRRKKRRDETEYWGGGQWGRKRRIASKTRRGRSNARERNMRPRGGQRETNWRRPPPQPPTAPFFSHGREMGPPARRTAGGGRPVYPLSQL